VISSGITSSIDASSRAPATRRRKRKRRSEVRREVEGREKPRSFYSSSLVHGEQSPPAPLEVRSPVFGGESASSANRVLTREVSARYTGSKHAAHYRSMALDTLRARCRGWRKCERARAREKKEESQRKKKRLTVGPGSTCQPERALCTGYGQRN
jgi:hypothetical protein